MRQSIILISCLILAAGLRAGEYEYDPVVGEEINEVCAGCHGEFGQGGSQGKYPRIAGLPYEYLVSQLLLFQGRARPNLPMVEHVEERQLPRHDVYDIARFLSEIELPTRLPPLDENAPGFDAYQRLVDAERLMQIPRAAGDTEKGASLYRKECGSCHGRNGEGDREKATPMLAGQYTNYLWRQVELFVSGVRIHDKDEPEDELLKEFSEAELRDIFAYVSVLDD